LRLLLRKFLRCINGMRVYVRALTKVKQVCECSGCVCGEYERDDEMTRPTGCHKSGPPYEATKREQVPQVNRTGEYKRRLSRSVVSAVKLKTNETLWRRSYCPRHSHNASLVSDQTHPLVGGLPSQEVKMMRSQHSLLLIITLCYTPCFMLQIFAQ
jgi:hypothetical protein